MKNNLLPLGSIIKVKDNEDKLVIVGKIVLVGNKQYDYACSKYPSGFNELEEFLYINDNEIMSICFLGDINN